MNEQCYLYEGDLINIEVLNKAFEGIKKRKATGPYYNYIKKLGT